MKFRVNINETLTRSVVVDAHNEKDAEYKVKQLYKREKIVLDYGDFVGEPTIDCVCQCSDLDECTKFD